LYYHKFPSAPVAIVSGISAVCRIPSIIDARVGRDNSIFLDVVENEYFVVGHEHLYWLAHFCGVTMDHVHVESGGTFEGAKVLSLSVDTSVFDCSPLFPPRGYVDDDGGFRALLPGEEDSEEGMDAIAALAASRRE